MLNIYILVLVHQTKMWKALGSAFEWLKFLANWALPAVRIALGLARDDQGNYNEPAA